MKLYLSKVRLNKGGCDSSGYYWGVGLPLYQYERVPSKSWRIILERVEGYVRAHNRDHAKELVRSIVPQATFFR
jgi:hypothetical protein